MTVVLALDVGERRIGVARSDGWGLLATPLTTVMRTSNRDALAAIGALIEREGATVLVVGLPLGDAGEPTVQSEQVAAFGRKLRALPAIEVVFWNERHSTAVAGERLREGRSRGSAAGRAGHRPAPSRRRREASRRQEDAAAAAVILQEFLDQQRGGSGTHRRGDGEPEPRSPGESAPGAAPRLEGT
jgi:putative Holliday junction resolvase